MPSMKRVVQIGRTAADLHPSQGLVSLAELMYGRTASIPPPPKVGQLGRTAGRCTPSPKDWPVWQNCQQIYPQNGWSVWHNCCVAEVAAVLQPPQGWVSEPKMTISYFYLLYPMHKKLAYKANFCEIYCHLFKKFSIISIQIKNFSGQYLTLYWVGTH